MRMSDWSSDVCSSELNDEAYDGLASLASSSATISARSGLASLSVRHTTTVSQVAIARPFWNIAWTIIQLDVPLRPMPVAIRSEEHTSEIQSLMRISYAVFCLNTKKPNHE